MVIGGVDMKVCQNCGAELNDLETRCPDCGEFYVNRTENQIRNYGVSDEGGFLWGLLGFCVPVAGLVLYLVWKDERPNNARAAGIGALVYVVGGVVFYILFILLALIFSGFAA